LSEEIDSFPVVSSAKIYDSLLFKAKFPCQEIDNFQFITRETMRYIDSSYRKGYVKVINFHCEGDKKLNCVHIYLINNNYIVICNLGDAIYCLNRIVKDKQLPNKVSNKGALHK
ncbi:MAG: hypothetical protein ABUT20_44015, partial [Bacteroidota bacterium]